MADGSGELEGVRRKPFGRLESVSRGPFERAIGHGEEQTSLPCSLTTNLNRSPCPSRRNHRGSAITVGGAGAPIPNAAATSGGAGGADATDPGPPSPKFGLKLGFTLGGGGGLWGSYRGATV